MKKIVYATFLILQTSESLPIEAFSEISFETATGNPAIASDDIGLKRL